MLVFDADGVARAGAEFCTSSNALVFPNAGGGETAFVVAFDDVEAFETEAAASAFGAAGAAASDSDVCADGVEETGAGEGDGDSDGEGDGEGVVVAACTGA